MRSHQQQHWHLVDFHDGFTSCGNASVANITLRGYGQRIRSVENRITLSFMRLIEVLRETKLDEETESIQIKMYSLNSDGTREYS